MENPKFKDALRDLLNSSALVDAADLDSVSESLRSHDEPFTVGRLVGLLRGLPPSASERRAISLVLEAASDRWLSDNWLLEDVKSRNLAQIAFKQMRSHVLAKAFVEYVQVEAPFRNQNHSEKDLVEIHARFKDDFRTPVEIEVFDIGP